ncbi:MAG: hypothetical protein AB7F59_00525 [Bdellovibrionales bacterium]
MKILVNAILGLALTFPALAQAQDILLCKTSKQYDKLNTYYFAFDLKNSKAWYLINNDPFRSSSILNYLTVLYPFVDDARRGEYTGVISFNGPYDFVYQSEEKWIFMSLDNEPDYGGPCKMVSAGRLKFQPGTR